ncbi:MAG: dephospho-CoA kinase [Parabacteroides sp.]|nr:dephospho-CoA kinase [Parabacteroides sp.]
MNQAQMQLLDMMSFVKTPEALSDLNKVISDYFARKADEEMNKLWDEGFLNDEKIEQFRHLHERTPYNKPTLQ